MPIRPHAAALFALAFLWPATQLCAQDSSAPDPAAALTDVLSAACRGDQTVFANSFTNDNAAAFRALPAEERKRLLQRFSLSEDIGKPLLSSDQDNHTVLRCERPGGTTEFRFGDAQVHNNLAFIPVSVVNSQSADFGLVREGQDWKLLSLGLVLLDIKQLSLQWAEEDMSEREDAAAGALETLSDAVDSYQQKYGKLPASLAELGPTSSKETSAQQAALVSAELAAGDEGGYRFRYRVSLSADSAGDRYVIEAVPENYGTTGRRSFFRDSTGKIHGADNNGAAATADDPLWQAAASQ
jgi:hypothetical protein